MQENLEQYLCFCICGIYYILPVMDVEKICLPGDTEKDTKWLQFGREHINPVPGEEEMSPCIIVKTDNEEPYAIHANEVSGVIEASPQDQFERPAELSSWYSWILGIFHQREAGRLLILLDSHKLGQLVCKS